MKALFDERIVKRYYTTINRALALPAQEYLSDETAPTAQVVIEDPSVASPLFLLLLRRLRPVLSGLIRLL